MRQVGPAQLDLSGVKKIEDRGSAYGSKQDVPLDGKHPLHLAVISGNLSVIRLLFSLTDLDPNVTDQQGYSALQTAAMIGNRDVIHLLLCFGADVNGRTDMSGNTCLHEVACRGFSKSLELLCHCRANPNIPNKVSLDEMFCEPFFT
ncbi:hypothetical protein P879_03925 [Paragonimus westermani]|uniref:Uncharacterized protein n=1 Tax=Paragonimus westermani TaxID=34504 RepID=A0A8T0DQR8_9TREM|nr:hypothetical protein P879_03925 [Paragonimus westermani]